jgi:hypothetical protein
MSAPIGPGDWVECVVPCNENDSAIQAHWLCGAEIIKGRVYRVMRIERGIDNFGEDSDGFVLVEKDTHFPRADGELGSWMVGHFSPIYRPDESLVAELLTQVPADDLVSA